MTSAYTRSRGDNVPAIIRHTPPSITSTREARPKIADVDSEFGTQLQPKEHERTPARAQAGAHAGPVGAAEGPGHPGHAEQRELVADMPRKRAEHNRVLGEQSLGGSGGERALGKQRRIEQEMDTESSHGGRKKPHV